MYFFPPFESIGVHLKGHHHIICVCEKYNEFEAYLEPRGPPARAKLKFDIPEKKARGTLH